MLDHFANFYKELYFYIFVNDLVECLLQSDLIKISRQNLIFLTSDPV